MKPAAVIRWSFALSAIVLAATVMLSPAEPPEDLETAMIDEVGANEIPNLIVDGIIEIGTDVVGFLKRMLIG
jgi:hypothetical protein